MSKLKTVNLDSNNLDLRLYRTKFAILVPDSISVKSYYSIDTWFGMVWKCQYGMVPLILDRQGSTVNVGTALLRIFQGSNN